MAFSGLKKQFNKANQYVSERISGVEGTKLDNEFQLMERRTDLMNELVEDLQLKTKEYLQPNPTVRAKMAAVKGISKLSGQAKASTYPQPEGTLGEAMSGYGRKLQDFDHAVIFAEALVEMGESLKQIADYKYSLDDNVKQNFLEPLHHTQSKDLKEVMHHRKKLQGRKLDFDCKKRKGATEEEIRLSEDKFAESLHLAQIGMHNLLDGYGVEHITQLGQLADSLLEYHRKCSGILQDLTVKLSEKAKEASSKPRTEFRAKTLEDLGIERVNSENNLAGIVTNQNYSRSNSENNLKSNGGWNSTSGFSNNNNPPSTTPGLISISSSISQSDFSRPHTTSSGFSETAWGHSFPTPLPRPFTSSSAPSCKALYDFDAENSTELSFKEGDTIYLKSRVDENWFEGTVNGRSGFFPVSYVTVVVPLS